MTTQIAPIGSVLHMDGKYAGSWLKINHGVDVPNDLMVEYFEKASSLQQQREERDKEGLLLAQAMTFLDILSSNACEVEHDVYDLTGHEEFDPVEVIKSVKSFVKKYYNG